MFILMSVTYLSCCTCRCLNKVCLHHFHVVRFRFVVFRPFIDELLVGTIRSSSPEGIRGGWQKITAFVKL